MYVFCRTSFSSEVGHARLSFLALGLVHRYKNKTKNVLVNFQLNVLSERTLSLGPITLSVKPVFHIYMLLVCDILQQSCFHIVVIAVIQIRRRFPSNSGLPSNARIYRAIVT